LNPKKPLFVRMTNSRLLLLMLLIGGVLIGGCSSTVRYSSATSSSSNYNSANSSFSTENYTLNEKQKRIIETARSLIGTPYCYGGEGNSCFDCSGYVNAAYRAAGIDLPRISRDIYKLGTSISISDAQPGDLVFFKRGSRINHVGIYCGNGKMLHASTSKGVMLQSLDTPYYRKRFVGIKRILK